ncbi:MAG: enoyl-CoA hydratase/isomerase family protein, partial [bacterium]|nr:enoyl-CoA hydratase/isomerase family protein [bacterium]
MADVITERREQVLWMRLNRPERLNAYDRSTVDEIIAALRQHADARVAVITGEGRAFCAGGYLANLADPDFWELRAMFTGSLELFDAIRSAPMPVIAAVNGPAFGGGNELVVVCDLAIASEKARFG